VSLEFFKEKKIWFIWLIALLVRIVLCFFPPYIFSGEISYLYYFQKIIKIPISFNGALLLTIISNNLTGTSNPIFIVLYFLGGLNWFNLYPSTTFVFPALIASFFDGVGLNVYGARVLLSVISSLGVITFNFFIKELTRNEDLITISTILYGFNLIGIYFAGQLSIMNMYYTLVPLILFLFLKQINATHDKNYILDPIEAPKKTLNLYIIILGLLVITFNFGIIIPIMYVFGLILWLIYSDSRVKLLRELVFLVIFALIPGIFLLAYGVMIGHPLAGFLNLSSIATSKSFDIFSILFYIVALGAAIGLCLPFAWQGFLNFDRDKLNKIFTLYLIILIGLCIGSPVLDTNLGYIIYSMPFLMFYAIQGYEEEDGEFWFIKKDNYPYLYIIVSFVIALLLILIGKLPG
jgi:hypothetical protein